MIFNLDKLFGAHPDSEEKGSEIQENDYMKNLPPEITPEEVASDPRSFKELEITETSVIGKGKEKKIDSWS